MPEEISSQSALVELLRRSIERIEFMDPAVADQLYELVSKCHIEALRSANVRLTNQVRTLSDQLDDAQVDAAHLSAQVEDLSNATDPLVVSADQIPSSMVQILNVRARKEHSSDGEVMNTLAQLINEWESLRWGRK